MESTYVISWKSTTGFASGQGKKLFTREEAEALIMQARLKAGWVTEADLAPPPAEEAAAEAEAPAAQ